MNANKSLLAVALLALGLGAGGLVLAGPGGGRGHGPMHDGGPVSLAEAEQKARERAEAMDADKDGFVTADEAHAYHQAQRAERMKRRFERRHGGDTVAVDALVAQRIERLKAMDANGDGTVDRDEFRAHRKAMREHRHGEGRRGPPQD